MLTALLLIESEAKAEEVVFEERFDSFQDGPLTGQDSWFGGNSGEVVTFGDAKSLGRRTAASGSAINDRYVWIETGVNTRATFSVDVRKSANTSGIFALGGLVDQSNSSRGLVLGLSGSNLIFWEGISAGTSVVLTDSTGAPIQTETNTWYRVRAELDLPGNRISAIYLQNLDENSASEQIYFGVGQAERVLVNPVSTWNLARVRVPSTTGTVNAWVDNLRLTVPNPLPTSLYDWSGATELYEGILHARLELMQPRRLVVNALRVDLRHPNIRLAHNPRAANWIENQNEAPIYTTRRFIETSRQNGLNMVVATNAGAYAHNSSNPEGTSVNVRGLALDRGTFLSPPEANYPSLLYDRAWEARIEQVALDFDSTNILTAASGFGFALRNGAPFGALTTPDPQTCFGLSKDGRYLVMMTIDGRQSGYSDGATPRESGNFLRYFGSFDGLRMDGGGSTTMAALNPANNAVQLLNRPSDRFLTQIVERRNASNLGVFYVHSPEEIVYADWMRYRSVPDAKAGTQEVLNPQGVPNLLAYLLNIHPLRGVSSKDTGALPALAHSRDGNFLDYFFRINRHVSGLGWSVEASETLSPDSWLIPSGILLEPFGTDPVTGDLLRRARIPLENRERFFIRLRGELLE